MATTPTNLPAKGSTKTPTRGQGNNVRPFESVRREFDRLFDELDRNSWLSPWSLFGGAPTTPTTRESAWMATPAIDVIERDDAYEITAEMPGMTEEDIEVSLVNGTISISGEKREDTTDQSADRYVRERRFGSFERSLALPDDVRADKIQANYTKGVLHVTLPKDRDAQSAKRRIDVKKS